MKVTLGQCDRGQPEADHPALRRVPAAPALTAPTPPSPADPGRVYRLVDASGQHHPIVDDLFESIEAAWDAALEWCEGQGLLSAEAAPLDRSLVLGAHFGMEVSTRRGEWRTLRHAALPAIASPGRPLALPHG